MANPNRHCLQNQVNIQSYGSKNDTYSFQDGQEDLPLHDEQFKFPPKRKIAPSAEVSNHKRYVLDQTQLCNDNNFSLLKDHSYAAKETLTDSEMSEEKSNSTDSNKKIPPIFLHDVNNHQEIVKDIESVVQNDFSTMVKSNSLKISLSDITDFRNLTSFYDENGIKFHTFQAIHDKKLEVVIRNVPYSLSDAEIQSELAAMGFPVNKVTRLLSKEKSLLPLCFVMLEKGERGNDIFKLEKLCHSIVSVEPKRRNKHIPQCTRCQRYGHTKNFCRLDARCVRCTGQHHFTQCRESKDAPPTCVNCGGSHSANFKGCKYYQDLLKSKNPNAAKRKETPLLSVTTDTDSITTNQRCANQPVMNSTSSSTTATYADITKGKSSILVNKSSVSSTRRNNNAADKNISDESKTTNECNTSSFNLEELIIDLVKSVVPILKNLIANIVSAFIK